jgi:hypothetical protein
VSLTLIFFFLIIAALLALLAWALRGPRAPATGKLDLTCLEETGRRHATYFTVIRQALSPADLAFLTARGLPAWARRVRKERRRIVLLYLTQLRDDFQRLLRLARAVAVVSPEVGAGQELERFWLSLQFWRRYQLLRLGLYSGLLSLPQLRGLSQMVSELAVQMEAAMKELGERAALAAKLASSLDRRGVDIP